MGRALALSGGHDKLTVASLGWEVDALLAGDFLEVVSMAMGEVAVVTAVATDGAGVVFSDEGTAASRPDVRSVFGTRSIIEIPRRWPLILDLEGVVLWCRFGPNTLDLPEFLETGETVADRLANCDVGGVTTAVVPPISCPEFPELRAAMQTVPIEADDVGRWVVG